MQPRLDESAIEQQLARLPGWSRDEKFIVRRYRFHSFPDAVAFVNRVAEKAERERHHPFIAIDYKVVTLRLTSWHAGGLTELDFHIAEQFDTLFSAAHPARDRLVNEPQQGE